MKIKTKKQMNLPQLIEWLLKSGHRNYIAISDMGNTVTLSRGGAIKISFGTFFPEETFTVEVEEEITEDTLIPKLVVNHSDTGLSIYKNDYINNDFPLESVRAFYILNDDLTMTLIWRDGKLIKE